MSAMALWKERQLRTGANKKISTLLNEKQLERNKYYVSSIFQIIQFICLNELPLRGDGLADASTLDANNDEEPSGLFLRLFEYTLSKDKDLREAYETIPKVVASYTSAMVQNEIIQILKDVIILESAGSDIRSSDILFFTLKADGTRDVAYEENILIVVRFVKDGQVHEKHWLI